MGAPSINDMFHSLHLALRLAACDVDEFFWRLRRWAPTFASVFYTFAGFFCFGLSTVSLAGLLMYFMPVMSFWQAALAYVVWAATVSTILIHWDF